MCGVLYTDISSEAFIQRLLILVFSRLGWWKLIYVLFCSRRRGCYTEKFFCGYVEILIQNAVVRSSLIWCRICWVTGLNWCRCSANPVPSMLDDLKELNESNVWNWASYLCILYEVSVDSLVTVTASSHAFLISQCKHTSTATQSRQRDEGFRGIPTDLSWQLDATTLF
jgi:hypothetical protein